MSMAEQNQATNPPRATPQGLNVPADNAGVADSPISAYPPVASSPTRRSYKRWIFLASLVVLAVAGAFLWHYLSGFESTDDAQVDVHLYPVSARISRISRRSTLRTTNGSKQVATLVEIDPKDNAVALARARQH